MNESISQAVAAPLHVDASIPWRLRQVARQQPNAAALLDGNGALTYRELETEAHGVAASLLATPDPGPVVILADSGPAAIAAMLGALTAGRPYVPLDPGDPPDRLRLIVKDSGATCLLIDSRYSDSARRLAPAAGTILHLGELPAGGDAKLPPVSPDAIAYIYYTSGSTGRPKGVPQTHRSLIHHATNYAQALQNRPGDRVSLLFTLSFSASIMDIYGGLLSGATLCPFDVRRHGMARLALWLAESGVTVLHTIPTVFRHLLAHVEGAGRFPQMRAIDLAGEPVFAEDVALFRKHFPAGCRLVNHLAASEVHVVAQFRLDNHEGSHKGALPVGPPSPGIEVRLLRPDGSEASAGEAGEMEIRSPFLTPGYWRNPELSARIFAEDPRGDQWRIYRSSDLAIKDASGRLVFLGRKDSLVKIRGHSVYPGEVEAALHRLESVRDAVVIAGPRANREGSLLVAWVIPVGRERPTRAALRRDLRRALPAYMIPEEFAFLEQFPTTATGKIDRVALSALDSHAEPETHRHHIAPVGDLELAVASLFGALLSVEKVGRGDNFFELGGDSLKASELQTELLRTLGTQLDLQDLVRNASVYGVAQALRRAGTRGRLVDSVMIPVRAEGTRPKLFLVHGGLGQAFISQAFLEALGPDQPLFSFQLRGLDGQQPTHRSIKSMAIDYNRTLLREEPQGPYVLCGLCSGGLVTLEMARRLQKVGHAPGAVILIDPPPRFIEGTSRQYKLRRAASLRQARRSIRHGGSPQTQDLVRRLRRQADFGHIAPTPQNEALVSAAMQAVLDFKLAVLWHRPRPYHGPVSVIHSRRRAGDRSRKCWRRHVRGNVHFFEAGAEHSDLFLQGNQAFAQQLRRCIDEGFHGGECGDELRQDL